MISPSTALAPLSAWSTSRGDHPQLGAAVRTRRARAQPGRPPALRPQAGRAAPVRQARARRRPAAGGGPPPARRARSQRVSRWAATIGPNGRRVLILLAERDPYAAEFAEFFLRTEGYEVVLALDAAEAERTSVERRPDLAVVEVMISGGTGAELCRRLKAHGVPSCLAISTLAGAGRRHGGRRGCVPRKPLDPLRFVSTVKDLLGRSAFLHNGPEGGR